MQASITMLMVGYVVIFSVKLIGIFARIRIMSHDAETAECRWPEIRDEKMLPC